MAEAEGVPQHLDDLADLFFLRREERDLIQEFDRLFMETAVHTNLVARSTLEDRWFRHFADSLQLYDLIPAEAGTVFDLGSGGGFPGILMAILSQIRQPDRKFTLVDSVGKKARFLQQVAAELDLTNVTVSSQRAEMFHVKRERYDLIMARAVAALPKLLDLTVPLLKANGLLIFPKGERAEEELTEAATKWRFELATHPSMTHRDATILLITNPEPRP